MPETKSSGGAAHVTSHDVARKAGVSVMTVSRAMSGEGYVAEKTREKVLAAARELGYTPNLSARMMKGSRTNVIGVLVNDLLSTVINEIVGAVSVSLRKCGMDLIIYNSMEDIAASGRTYTILPLHFVAADIAAGRLQAARIVNPRISRTVLLATSTHHPISRAASEVAALVREVTATLVRSGELPGRLERQARQHAGRAAVRPV